MRKRKTTPSFRFTATEPTPLVKDFDTFIDYLAAQSIPLSKQSAYLPYKHLMALNAQMSAPNTENTPRTPQPYYSQLHFYYHLALEGKLVQKASQKSALILKPTERLNAYRALSDAAKYFFLLETLWIDCAWGHLGVGRTHIDRAIISAQFFLTGLSTVRPGQKLSGSALRSMGIHWWDAQYIKHLALFGWYHEARDEKRYQEMATKSAFPVASITPSAFGIAMIRILLAERPLERWNLPFRRSIGELVDYPGQDLETDEERGPEPFVAPFQNFCEGEPHLETLPRKKREYVKGNFVFKVSLGNIWRKIALSSGKTLDDLHMAIQDAFDFDADHLYAFFMDNQPWSDYSYESPYSEEGISAADVRIGDVELVVNQSFLYLFDFGDEWRFNVQLLEIRQDERLLRTPKIVKTHGEAPEQYPDWDEM